MQHGTMYIFKSHVISLIKTCYTWWISLPPMTMIPEHKKNVHRISRKKLKYYNGQYFAGRTH